MLLPTQSLHHIDIWPAAESFEHEVFEHLLCSGDSDILLRFLRYMAQIVPMQLAGSADGISDHI